MIMPHLKLAIPESFTQSFLYNLDNKITFQAKVCSASQSKINTGLKKKVWVILKTGLLDPVLEL